MTPHEKKALIAQLLAHRDTMAAALAQTDATLVLLGVDLEDGEPGECEHPAEKLENRSAFGAAEFHCHACNQTFDHHPHHPKE